MSGVTETSRAAFLATAGTRQSQAAYVYRALKDSGPLTDPELVAITGIRLSSVNGSRNELMRMGLVKDSGRRQTNPATGMRNILWAVAGVSAEDIMARIRANRVRPRQEQARAINDQLDEYETTSMAVGQLESLLLLGVPRGE